MGRINKHKVFIDAIDTKSEASKLELFELFLKHFPDSSSKEELLLENNKLIRSDFKELIELYYEV